VTRQTFDALENDNVLDVMDGDKVGLCRDEAGRTQLDSDGPEGEDRLLGPESALSTGKRRALTSPYSQTLQHDPYNQRRQKGCRPPTGL
jgi:hypothetical protein